MTSEPQSKGTILLIEDHQDIAEMMFTFFEQRGYTLDYAADGAVGMVLANENRYDAIVLDLMLPRVDGIEVCRRLRTESGDSTPILMLTARDTLEDKIAGLNVGADDYLVKPFDINELEARVNALIRRNRGDLSNEILRVGDLTFDIGTFIVKRGSQQINLSPVGFKLLKILLKASPQLVTRREIERTIWGDLPPDSDALRSHMYNLRKAIDRPFSKSLLHTVQSQGYRIYDPDA
jgi:DNA-binding response OmpR family regulator